MATISYISIISTSSHSPLCAGPISRRSYSAIMNVIKSFPVLRITNGSLNTKYPIYMDINVYFEDPDQARSSIHKLADFIVNDKTVSSKLFVMKLVAELDYDPDLPLLKYVGFEVKPDRFSGAAAPKEVFKILNRYTQYTTSRKQAIWNCQKELIDAGFEGNAKW
jgi:hypothetical protein